MVVLVSQRFNPPPGWPPAPQGWLPPPGWRPPASWPPLPHGWQLVVDEDQSAAGEDSVRKATNGRSAWARLGALVVGLATVVGTVAAVIQVRQGGDAFQPNPAQSAVTLDDWAAAASKKCVELEQRSGQFEAALKEADEALKVGERRRAVDVVHSAILRIKDWYAELARLPAPAEYQSDISEAIRLASTSFDLWDRAIQSAAAYDEAGFVQGQQSALATQSQAAAVFGRLGARGCGSG